VGCGVGQIVKSLILKGETTGELYLVLTSGSNRVCVDTVAALAGEPVVMADAGSVREKTGFAIGGVPPLAHREPVRAFVDEELLAHDALWAAAGSPNALFRLAPAELLRITGGTVARIGTPA
jgi:prolyl-tRNA editing enzyme YbaK/EbsC (Cys-tRNA(Pro) deacylase)